MRATLALVAMLASPLLCKPFLLTPSFLGSGALLTLVRLPHYLKAPLMNMQELAKDILFAQGGTTITAAHLAELLGLAGLGLGVKAGGLLGARWGPMMCGVLGVGYCDVWGPRGGVL